MRLTFLAIVLSCILLQGCGDSSPTEQPQEPQARLPVPGPPDPNWVMRDISRLDLDWSSMTAAIDTDAALRQKLDTFVLDNSLMQEPFDTREALEKLYDTMAYGSDTDQSRAIVDLLVELNAWPLVWEAIYHMQPYVVIKAADAVVDEAPADGPDTRALPYLVSEYERLKDLPGLGNFPEFACDHLAKAIGAITDIDPDAPQFNDRYNRNANAFLAEVRAWAKQNNIPLFEEQ